MYPIYFKAQLKTSDDRLLEEGYACISLENKSVDFKNAFVPLMKMGTSVKIVQLVGDQQTHCFNGQVYLSTGNMLRIVSVSDEELTAAEKQLEISSSIPAHILPVHSGFAALHLPHKKEDWLDAEIYSISLDSVKFTCPRQFLLGQKLLLHTDEPLLRKTLIEVYQAILFGEGAAGHLCSVESVPEPYRTGLCTYVEQSNSAAPRFFPGES